MIWRFHSLPELEHLSDAERSLLLSQCINWLMYLRIWLACVVRALFLAVPMTYFTGILLNGFTSIVNIGDLRFLMVFPVSLFILTALFYQLEMIRTRGRIRIYLHNRRRAGEKPPVCLKCGYSVEDSANHCPECGARV